MQRKGAVIFSLFIKYDHHLVSFVPAFLNAFDIRLHLKRSGNVFSCFLPHVCYLSSTFHVSIDLFTHTNVKLLSSVSYAV